jgi:hypothetical protein
LIRISRRTNLSGGKKLQSSISEQSQSHEDKRTLMSRNSHRGNVGFMSDRQREIPVVPLFRGRTACAFATQAEDSAIPWRQRAPE